MDIELTNEQQFNLTTHRASLEHALEMERVRGAAQLEAESRKVKLELIRMAKDILIENKRNAPVGEREITQEMILDFAEGISNFVNS